VFVADGYPNLSLTKFPNIDHISLSKSHQDAGATPRALGAISAFSQGYDAVSFLDADNTYLPMHLEIMVDVMTKTVSDVVSATRNICTQSGDHLYVDGIESNGTDFCDTNCLFIGKSCLNLLTYWITTPAMRLWSDRQFWSVIIQSGISKTHCPIPTVNYHTKWAWHYQHAGRIPPADSVWIDKSADGSLIHTTHI
jgi:hypothetical protein